MYYKLNKRLLLRGWDKLPYALVDTDTGKTEFVPAEVMNVLRLSNGKVDLDLPVFPAAYREIAERLHTRGAIAPCEAGDSILPVQEYRLYQNRYIESAHWSVTGRCNYRCKHCYMSAFDGRYGELDHDAAMSIAEQLADCGIFRVSLTGGEPLLRKDFLEIVDALIRHGITITTIYSNGQLVNERLLAALENRGIHPEFNFSFDGTEGWHDWLRGVDDASAAIDRAFRLCREHGFPTGAEMCIHDRNKHTLRDSVNYLASVGCRSLKVTPISDVGAWHEGGYGTSISPRDALELYLDYVPHFYEDGCPLYIQLGGFFVAPGDPNSKHYTTPIIKKAIDPDVFCVCGHARRSLYISPEGRMLPCMALTGMGIQQQFPLITESGLRECLVDSKYLRFITAKAREVLNHNEECRNCEYAPVCCGGCRASALEAVPDDPLAPDKAACLIMKGGYADRLREVVRKVDPEIKGNW